MVYACRLPSQLVMRNGSQTTLVLFAFAAGCQVQERFYRLGSVGQDTNLCLWDLVIEEDPAVNAATGQTGGLK